MPWARCSDGALDHLDVPGDARIRPVADGWEVDIPASGERDKYDERRMMRRAPKRLTRSHFSPEQWAAVKLGRKFYQSEVSEGSRRNGAWDYADRDMDRAGWNEDNSQMPVRAARDWGETWDGGEGGAGSRDRYYHWVTADGRTDTDGAQPPADAGATEARGTSMQASAEHDSKPSWLVVRQSARDGTIKVERDARGNVKRIAVPVSAVVEPQGSGSWQIRLPKAASAPEDDAVVHVADARDPANPEKVETVTRQWASVSAPGDLPGEDATVQNARGGSSRAGKDDTDAQLDGQAVDRAAYGIPERVPEPSGGVRSGEGAPPRRSRDALAAPRQVWGGWEPARKPITDVYAPNEDPFYCMDGSESSICGTTGRPEQEHDFSLGWDGVAKAQRALAREKSRDHAGELGELQRRAGYRETPASGDPYKYIRHGNYARILRDEDRVMGAAAGRTGHVDMSAGEQGKDREEMEKNAQVERSMESMHAEPRRVPNARREDGGSEPRGGRRDADRDQTAQLEDGPSGDPRTVPPLPYKVRAPYDGSLVRVGYPNMRGGMRAEDGELLPYDDRSGAGNNVISHKDWASDVWAHPSVWGVRDVRDSLNRNEAGGAGRLVDDKGFHEYEAGNRGFHEPLPYDRHDADDSRESSHLRVDQFDVAGDEEGRRRAARGGDGNADEFDASRAAAKADYDEDMGTPHRNRDWDGDTRHIYMPYAGKAASWTAALGTDAKRAAALRIAERAARRRAQTLRSDGRRAEGGDPRDQDEDLLDRERRERARHSDSDYEEERREHDEEERINREREDEKGFERRALARRHERDAAVLRRWSRRAARDSELAAASQTELAAPPPARLEQLSQTPLSPSALAAEQRVNAIAEAKLKAQAARSTAHSLASVTARLAEEHVNEVAQRKLAAEARLARRHGVDSTASLQTTSEADEGAAATGTGSEGRGPTAKISHSISSWLGAYEKHAALPARTTLSAGVDAVDDYNDKALAHVLSSAHGGDGAARLTARQAYSVLKSEEHPQQLALKRRCVSCSDTHVPLALLPSV